MFFTWTKKAAPPAVRALYSCLNDTHSLSPFSPLSLFISPLSFSLTSLSYCQWSLFTLSRAKKHTKQQQVIQIPSTALARNRQESFLCVSEHTHTHMRMDNIWVHKQLAVWCCFCKNKPTTWSDSSSTLFEYLFALVFLVVVVPD